MGRAIVREPQAFLMDEPLSNLDAKLRVQMRAEIHQLQRRLGVTTIYVTHDQVEAMTMGDRVAVMNGGHLQQVDTPQALYDQPVNEFVAGFIGSPSINLVEAQLEQTQRRLRRRLRRPPPGRRRRAARNRSALKDYVGQTVILGIRPEDFEDASVESDAPSDRRLKVEVRAHRAARRRGARPLRHRARPASSRARSTAEPARTRTSVSVAATAAARRVSCARVSPRTTIAEREA